MAIKNIELIQIEAVLDSLGRKQIGVEADVDSELNFRMWGGKDSTGVLTHWLAKNKPGLLHSLRLSSLSGQSQSIAILDANGNIIRGSIDSTDLATKEYVDAKATSSRIQDNAYDSDENPTNPDNITEVQELTFFRNIDTGANYPRVSSGERDYGILLPPPSLASDQDKVPVYKAGDQIAWEPVQTAETIEHILDLSTLDEENSTFDVILTANRNNAISFVESSEQTATVAIEIEDNKPYHIQIVGACTLAITGVEWWSDAITDVTNKAEINVMNGRAMGVLIDV